MLYDLCPCDSGKKFKFCCHEYYVNIVRATQEKGPIKMPVFACYAGRNISENGIVLVIVTRGASYGQLLAGVYLVDTWCLGVKDTYLRVFKSKEKLDSYCLAIGYTLERFDTISYEKARSIIFGGVQFAATVEIAPHEEWHASKYMLEPDRPFENSCKFGKKGNPFYCAGPYDGKVCDNYIRKVEKHGGHWMIPCEFEE